MLDIVLVLVFILIGGFFAASEISLVSLREGQVRHLRAVGGRRGQVVADLSADPNRFLAAVQVGVTLAGFMSAAFGASTLTTRLSPVLLGWGLSSGVADTLALVVVTLVISYVALVLGELAPKRVGLQRAESIALAVAPSVDRLARYSRPVIWLLSRSTDGIVRLLGGDPKGTREAMSEEELREMVAAYPALGAEERRLIAEVFEAGDRQLHEVMVPRTEVSFIDASTPVFRAVKDVSTQPHSRYPVVRGSQDEVVGFVHVRDLFDPEVAARSVRVGDLAREVKQMPGTVRVLTALSEMRREGHHLAIVVDEYGGTDGIVTLEDLVEELVGDIHDEYDVEAAHTRRLRGGDLELDGLLNLDAVCDAVGVELPEGPYETLGGFVLARLGRVAQVGDVVEVDPATGSQGNGGGTDGQHGEEHDVGAAPRLRLSVTEMDGRRVARVRVASVGRDGGAGERVGTDPGASSVLPE